MTSTKESLPEVVVLVPADTFQAALNYIRHVGANAVMRGQPHPQQWIVDGLELAAANSCDWKDEQRQLAFTEGRRAGLEEAAKSMDAMFINDYGHDFPGQTIRALKERP